MNYNPLHIIQSKVGVTRSDSFNEDTARAIMHYLQLNPLEAAHFLGQCHHESGGFRVFEENLNYSWERLLLVFPRHFRVQLSKEETEGKTDQQIKDLTRFREIELARSYDRNPQKIANRVYANRMGNGNEASGDGWKHRGFGPIQLTGKVNQSDFAKWIGDPEIIKNPSLISTRYPLDSAHYFFEKNKLYHLCTDLSNDTINTLTRRINGGTHGLDDRIRQTKRIATWLNPKT
ncbi:glycoside hydrolase family 19 protein [Mongoliibacter ruber]|uniref:Putative chitinase n=1 Tax=Mongoliibacter ruber TaxID=1750599 RepID=A0A2T0WV49_9BACT|nr:glycoside hydrolase family 19 protein [Mongoliibacter ruber]PRY90572.1 putative chitinase [Mongoliibacter ruber]